MKKVWRLTYMLFIGAAREANVVTFTYYVEETTFYRRYLLEPLHISRTLLLETFHLKTQPADDRKAGSFLEINYLLYCMVVFTGELL